ncbi:hypothetical protein NV377_11390 [Paenibacillus sp. T3-5-0-4]|nr:hypothetical protein [Paenibacillus endoradicis]
MDKSIITIGGFLLNVSISRSQNATFQVYVFRISSIKRYFALDIIGGFAFYMLGRMLFGSELISIGCNIVASQMLQYIVPVSSN